MLTDSVLERLAIPWGVHGCSKTLGVREEGLSNRPYDANVHGVSERGECCASGFGKAMGVRKALET